MSDDIFPLPFKPEAKLVYAKTEEKKVFDSKNFPPCTNKIEDVGLVRKRKYLIKCDGYGHMGFVELKSPLQILEELAKLKDKGIITDEEFERKKSEILKTL